MTSGYCPTCGEFIGNKGTHSCSTKYMSVNWTPLDTTQKGLLIEILRELKEINRLLKIIEYTGRKQ